MIRITIQCTHLRYAIINYFNAFAVATRTAFLVVCPLSGVHITVYGVNGVP